MVETSGFRSPSRSGLDQSTRDIHNRRHCSVNRNPQCLKVVDRFRTPQVILCTGRELHNRQRLVTILTLSQLKEQSAVPRYSAIQKDALNVLMRDHVHQHAVEILESQGAEGLTLERLAERIGISRGTLYNYFADRDAIVEFVEDRVFSPILTEIEAIGEADNSPVVKMECLLRKILGELIKNQALYFAISQARPKVRARQDNQATRAKSVFTTIRKIVREGINSGDFIDLPADLSATIISGSMEGVLDEMGRAGDVKAPEEIIPAFLAIVLGGLTCGKYTNLLN